MFIGHFAVAFAAKRAAPRVSLGTFILATQWLDGLWPIFLLLGIERVAIRPGITRFTPLDFEYYPWSHSLAMTLVWAALFAAAYYWRRRDLAAAAVLAAAVASHWVLDWISHRPDLPLYPGGPLVGLGLWNAVAATLATEAVMFMAALALYFRTTRAADAIGSWGLWAFLAFLVAAYLGAAFGPPPPDVRVLAYTGLSGWLLVAWGYWIDAHRTAR